MRKKIHFIGVGGIGMSALARICLDRGDLVTGSDRMRSALVEELIAQGLLFDDEQRGTNLTPDTLVVYSTAVKQENEELKRAKKLGCPLMHRSDFLKDLIEEKKKSLLITGTHGKTTTSSLLAHVLETAGRDPSYVLGGIPPSLGKNGKEGSGEEFAVEADESDGSFLNGQGFGAIITNIGIDHLDYWKSEEKILEGFTTFASHISSKKHLFWCSDNDCLCSLGLEGISYGFGPQADLQIFSFKQQGWKSFFSFTYAAEQYDSIELALIGRHNVLNAAAVFGLCLQLGLSEEEIREGMKSFKGVKRRLEKKAEKREVLLFDDYAHHPTEIKALLTTVRQSGGGRRAVAIYQPHRYTRLRDTFEEQIEALSQADLLFITDVHSAGEQEIANINARALCDAIQQKTGKRPIYVPRKELLEQVPQKIMPHDLVLTIGAGDITQFSTELAEHWKSHPPAKMRIAVLFGGMSSEHEVTINSSEHIYRSLNRELYDVSAFWVDKKGGWYCGEDAWERAREGGFVDGKIDALKQLKECDLAIPIFHGQFGEDGCIHGLLEMLSIPYTGCNPCASAIAMDKGLTKRIAMSHGIQTAPFVECEKAQYYASPKKIHDRVEQELTYPLFVKASHLGSSFEVWRVETKEELKKAIESVFTIDFRLIIEEEIIGREMEFGVLGNTSPLVMHPCEILTSGQFFSYEKKYGDDPMPIDVACKIAPDVLAKGKQIVEKTFLAVGCRGYSRLDFFLTADGDWVFNEVNAIPGLTATSRFPKICRAWGFSDEELVNHLIIYALERDRVEVEPMRGHTLSFTSSSPQEALEGDHR